MITLETCSAMKNTVTADKKAIPDSLALSKTQHWQSAHFIDFSQPNFAENFIKIISAHDRN